jgi:hypothetical protein
VRVSAAVLSPQETRNSFALPLAERGIQPVWIEIENQEDKGFYLMVLSVDPNYFSPSELAWMFRAEGDDSLDDRIEKFLDKHVPVVIPPHSTVSGYVYTNLDPGAKAFAVELFGKKDVRTFEFVQEVPGFESDFRRVDFHRLYRPDEVRDLNLDGLRRYLEQLPCCVLGGDQKTPGDPLNLVIVDEARLYITLDIAAAQSLRAVGYVKGVGYSDRQSPRYNYTGDPYYTDGLRVVLILGAGQHALDDIDYLPWEPVEARQERTRK